MKSATSDSVTPVAGAPGDRGRDKGQPRWFWIGLGLGLATAATLILEIVLTRIFSVILWYHYGFLAISLALLGLGLAGIVVYLYPERFPRERAAASTAVAGLLFAASTLAALLAFHWIVSVGEHWPLGTGYRTLTFLVVLVPLFFAGLCVAIPISRYTERIGVLYAADLVGAAIGAVAVIPLLALLGGHPSVIACAGLACLSALCFSIAAGARPTLRLAAVGILICAAALPLALSTDFFRIRYTKMPLSDPPLADRWNSFSRVAVYRHRVGRFGWNLGKGAPWRGAGYVMIRIDGGAATPMLSFKGNLEALDYLRFDITALGYQLRSPQSALIIGSGGGRDIITAKLLGVERIQAVEVNPLVVDFVRKDFREYSGSPYDLEGVSFAVEDGRSFAARSRESFDMVQLSAVDTWAALAAGALSLVENSLYTVEAFQDYHDRLSEDGLVSITRQWTSGFQVVALRTVDIVRAAWESRGHEHPDQHIVIVAPGSEKWKWGTMLVSRRPFRIEEVQKIARLARQLGFKILYEPNGRWNPQGFTNLFGPDRESFLAHHAYNVAATRDDRPFFFFFDRPFRFGTGITEELTRRGTGSLPEAQGLMKTPRILLQAFALVAGLVALLAFGIPVLLGRLRLGDARASRVGLLYFAGIGLGFILVEVALIQRYTLLLGQPLYAFSGILGCILVFSGLGSLMTHSIREERLARAATLALAALMLGVVAHAFLMPPLLRGAMRFELGLRFAYTIATVAPLGFVMGMPLPLGMRLMERASPKGLAWAWGVNGSLSVMGTVLAMTTSVYVGITSTMLTGALAYLLAVPVFARAPSRAAAAPGGG
jgi:predicted membrane-bound spermidine synthase